MSGWSSDLDVQQVRIARPTDRLEAVARFYGEGLGLAELGRFADHDGYSGVFFGLPGAAYHLEFTSHADGSPCPAPTRDNLLVLYLVSTDATARRLRDLGHAEVEPENPYWARNGAVQFEDPDGWGVMLVPGPAFG